MTEKMELTHFFSLNEIAPNKHELTVFDQEAFGSKRMCGASVFLTDDEIADITISVFGVDPRKRKKNGINRRKS
jgi:hypothetical protein